jgi:hypothetical protein
MKARISWIVQLGGSAIHLANLAIGSGYLSPLGVAKVAYFVGIVQTIVGLVAHYSNPDGTAAPAAAKSPAP